MTKIDEKDMEKTVGGVYNGPMLHKVLRPSVPWSQGQLEAYGNTRHEADCECPIGKFNAINKDAASGCCKDCAYATLSTADTTGYYCNQ